MSVNSINNISLLDLNSFIDELNAGIPLSFESNFIYLKILETPIGEMLAGAVDESICLLEFLDRKMLKTQLKILSQSINYPLIFKDDKLLDTLAAQLNEYFLGERKIFELNLISPGTQFQNSVWQKLNTIEFGETCSYLELARLMGKPEAIRAVANANGANRIAIIIPCHRVIGSDGCLTGYGGGLWRKRFLLELENKNSSLFD